MLRKFYSDAGVLSIADLLVRLKGLVILPFLTHRFGAVDYGVWSQVQVLVTATAPFLVLGTDSGFMRYAAGLATDDQRRRFCAWVVFLAAAGTLIAAGLIAFRGFFARVFFDESADYPPFIVLAAINLLIVAGLNAARNWFLLVDRPRVTAHFAVLQAGLGLAAVAATLIFKLDVYTFVALSLCADLLTAAGMAWVFLRQYGWSVPDFPALGPMLRFGLPLVPGGFAMWGLNLMDRLFLVRYGSISEVGIYSFAYTIGATVAPLLARPFRTMYPALATSLHNQGRNAEHQRIFNYSAGTVVALTLPAIAGLQLASGPIMAILAPPEFARGADILGAVMAGYVLTILASYYAVHLGLVHRQQWHTVALMTAVAVNLVLNILLIPPWGIYGAAAATVGSFAVEFAITAWVATRRPVVRTDFRFVGKVLLCTALMTAAVKGLEMAALPEGANPVLRLIAIIFAGAASYAAAAWALGVVPRETLARFLSGLRR